MSESHEEPEPEVEPGPENEELQPAQELRSVLEAAATDGVRRRDVAIENEARAVIGSGTELGARLGRLAEWAIWLSGAHGSYPPRPLARVSLVHVGSTPPAEHPVHRLAALSSVASKTVALQSDSALKDAAATGITAIDAVIDEGCDLLVCTAILDDALTGTLVALLLHLSATEVVGDSAYLDDRRWADRVATIRDLTHPARQFEDDPVALLQALDSPELVALTGMLLRAAARRTPVLLDGAADCAAALCASRISILASWWYAAPGSGDPATTRAIEALGLDPLVDLGSLLDGGAAALTALPLLRTAQLLASDPPPP